MEYDCQYCHQRRNYLAIWVYIYLNLKLLLKCNHCIHTSIIREIAILDEFDNYLVNNNMHYLNVLMIKIKIIPL